jgi:hypothetical protein
MARSAYFASIPFEFVGGPYDGETLPVTDQGDGLPEILVLPHGDAPLTFDDPRPPAEGPPTWTEHRYERDGSVYRHLGIAEPA